MSNTMQQLDAESLLMLYAVDELPAEDRLRVDRMLAADAGLRDKLEMIGSSFDEAGEMLREADVAEPIRVSSAASARRFGKDIRAWQARKSAMPASVDAARRRLPVWVYPIAGAAVVVIGVATWWRATQEGTVPIVLKPLIVTQPYRGELAEDSGGSFGGRGPLAFASQAGPNDGILDDAEEELYAMADSSSTLSPISLIGEVDDR